MSADFTYEISQFQFIGFNTVPKTIIGKFFNKYEVVNIYLFDGISFSTKIVFPNGIFYQGITGSNTKLSFQYVHKYLPKKLELTHYTKVIIPDEIVEEVNAEAKRVAMRRILAGE